MVLKAELCNAQGFNTRWGKYTALSVGWVGGDLGICVVVLEREIRIQSAGVTRLLLDVQQK